MSPRSSCLFIGRRVGYSPFESSLPRRLAFSSPTRSLSAVGLQRVKVISGRLPPYSPLLLPGSTRNFWWSSSKTTTPAPPNPEVVETAENITDASSVSEQPPEEVTAVVDTAQDAAVSAATSPVPDVPIDSTVSTAADAVENISSLVPPPPLNYGDLAALGLGGWSPIGISHAAIESLQVFTGMPWFWTIVSATVLTRVVLFPFTVMGLRNSARLAPYQKQMNEIREEMETARTSGDPLRMQKAVVKQRLLYKQSGVSMAGMFVPTLVQVPVTLGMFFAVKRMCDLPVEQLKYSGFDLIPDLTVADPTWMLPLVTTAAINLQLSLSIRDMAATNPNVGHMINLFRGLSLLGFIFMTQFPSGTLVYLLTGVTFMSLQSAAMRLPTVRRLFGIPALPKNLQAKPYTMLESIKHARDSWRKKREESLQQTLRARK